MMDESLVERCVGVQGRRRVHGRDGNDNGMEGVELRWWKGAEVFKEGDGYTPGMATTPGRFG